MKIDCMEITPENFKIFNWPETDLSLEESLSISEKLDNLNVSLFKGELSVEDYNQKINLLMYRIEKNSLKFGKDHDLFKKFLLLNYKDKDRAKETAEHEKKHADFLKKNGVEDYSFRLKLFTNGKVQPYTHYIKPSLPSNDGLSFHKEFLSAPGLDMSESDQKSFSFLSSA